jgi:Zn-dependent protease with chaperone function
VLYGIADEVARSVGAPAVDEIRVGDTFNASFSLVGWRRKRVMCLGLPLFSILTPQERVALIGHELGHCVNGDITRTLVVDTAINTLVDWYGILHPGSIWARAGRLSGWEGLATIPTNLIMMGLAQMAR